MMRITETVKVLIIINALFFLGTLLNEELFNRLFALYYFDSSGFKVWQVVTHMFMHGGMLHILFNMYALWAFGSPLEYQWGRKKFLFFYFSAGLGAALIHTLVNYYHVQSGFNALMAAGMTETEVYNLISEIYREWTTNSGAARNIMIPKGVDSDVIVNMVGGFEGSAVGASGAIYGVLVAFGLLYPNVELMLLFVPVPIKAKYFIPGLLLLDLFSGVTGFSLFGQSIAHWAHIGGALFGFIMAYYWKRNSFNKNRWD